MCASDAVGRRINHGSSFDDLAIDLHLVFGFGCNNLVHMDTGNFEILQVERIVLNNDINLRVTLPPEFLAAGYMGRISRVIATEPWVNKGVKSHMGLRADLTGGNIPE